MEGAKMRALSVIGFFATSIIGIPAGAIDLTGTWTGKESCVYGGTTSNRVRNTAVSLDITQSGADINAHFSGAYLSLFYNGYVHEDADKPEYGRLGLIYCNNTKTSSVTGEMKVRVKADGSGKLKGTVVRAVSDAVANCKYSLTRVSTVDPAVSGLGCP